MQITPSKKHFSKKHFKSLRTFLTISTALGGLSLSSTILIGCGGGGTPKPEPTPTPDPTKFSMGYTGRLRDENDHAVLGTFLFEGKRYPTNDKGEFTVALSAPIGGGVARIEAGTNYYTRVDNVNLMADSIGQHCVPTGNYTLDSGNFRLNVPVADGATISLGTFRLYTTENAVPPPCLNSSNGSNNTNGQ